jgi:hypothetical protein
VAVAVAVAAARGNMSASARSGKNHQRFAHHYRDKHECVEQRAVQRACPAMSAVQAKLAFAIPAVRKFVDTDRWTATSARRRGLPWQRTNHFRANVSFLACRRTGSPSQEAQVRNSRFAEVRSIVSTGLGSDPCLKTCA